MPFPVESAPIDGARHRILLVEDDASVRRSLQLLLSGHGYEVRAYPSGAGLATDPEALRADCLVADLVIPEGDALELLQELRRVGWAHPAVLISGRLTDEWAARARAQGFAAIFQKPLTDAALTSCVDRLTGRLAEAVSRPDAGTIEDQPASAERIVPDLLVSSFDGDQSAAARARRRDIDGAPRPADLG